MDDDIFNSFAHSLLHVMRDMFSTSQPMDSLVPVCQSLIACICLEQQAERLKRMLKLLQLLFTSVDQLKFHMVEKDIFVQLLDCIGTKTNEECQALLLNFFKMELAMKSDDEQEGAQRWSDPGLITT